MRYLLLVRDGPNPRTRIALHHRREAQLPRWKEYMVRPRWEEEGEGMVKS